MEPSVDVVTTLLEHGATVDARDVHRQTPLLLAAQNNCFDVARLLLKHGAAVDVA